MEISHQQQIDSLGVAGRLFLKLAGKPEPYSDPLEVG
jgi:hypothetical protein